MRVDLHLQGADLRLALFVLDGHDLLHVTVEAIQHVIERRCKFPHLIVAFHGDVPAKIPLRYLFHLCDQGMDRPRRFAHHEEHDGEHAQDHQQRHNFNGLVAADRAQDAFAVDQSNQMEIPMGDLLGNHGHLAPGLDDLPIGQAVFFHLLRRLQKLQIFKADEFLLGG